MTAVWGVRRVDEGRPDRASAGVCTFGGSAHLAPMVWRFGDDKPARAYCERHIHLAIDGAPHMGLYASLQQCPKWSKKATGKHEHGKDCLA